MAANPALFLQAGVQVVSAVLYLWVARIVLSRDLAPEARAANAHFATWWVALGLLYATLPIYTLSTRVFGYRDLAFAVTYINVLLVLIVVAAWGLVNYLLYLYTGSRRWWAFSSVFYAALAVVFLYLIAWLQPIGFEADGRLDYAREQLVGGPAVALGLSYSLPVFLAALAYGSLLFRVRDPLPRYRIALVAGGFMLQFGWSSISAVLQLSRRYPNSITLAIFGNVIAILAAIAILLAFRPPRAVRQRLDAASHGGT